MDRHCDNALAVANHLRKHKKVDWVRYAGLSDHPDFGLVKKYCSGKAAGILSFGIKGGREAGSRFIDVLQLITRLVNIVDAKSLACHPATTTHRQLSPEELIKAGVADDLVRLSIGLEHFGDINSDIGRALSNA
jgi:O-acetylhomoserine (thiol)-lyase